MSRRTRLVRGTDESRAPRTSRGAAATSIVVRGHEPHGRTAIWVIWATKARHPAQRSRWIWIR